MLDLLSKLGSFTQMCPNFLRHLLTLVIKAREERLLFGLDELRHLCILKRNNRSRGTFLMSPRPGDLTQITISSELLSQIRGSIVVLRDQIHKELGNLINLIRIVKLVCFNVLNLKLQVCEQVIARLIDWSFGA